METKTAAPKGVKNKKLWDKIEKSVKKENKYKGDRLYKVIQKAYKDAGGEYTHKSDKKSESAVEEVIKLGKIIDAKLNKQAWQLIHTQSGEVSVSSGLALGRKGTYVHLTTEHKISIFTRKEALQVAKALIEHAEQLTDEALMGEMSEENEARDRTIKEIMEKQDRSTVPAPDSEDEAELYKELLKMLQKDVKKKEAQATKKYAHKMPDRLEFWTLDEVAEALPVSREVSSKLWSLMPKDEDIPPKGEWPEPDSLDRKATSLKSKWHLLTPEEQAEIIKAYNQEFGEIKNEPKILSFEELPKAAQDLISDDQKSYIDEFIFKQLANGHIEAWYAGELLATWNGKGWME